MHLAYWPTLKTSKRAFTYIGMDLISRTRSGIEAAFLALSTWYRVNGDDIVGPIIKRQMDEVLGRKDIYTTRPDYTMYGFLT